MIIVRLGGTIDYNLIYIKFISVFDLLWNNWKVEI